MELWVSVTPDNMREYPMHSHGVYEIICYTYGRGRLQTERGALPFERGTLFIVPPGLKHRSVSESGFVNICAHASDPVLCETELVTGVDNAEHDAQTLAAMLLRTFMSELGGEKTLSASLYGAYRDTVLRLISCGANDVAAALCRALSDNIGNAEFDVAEYMANSGFATDYVRALFKARYGIPPVKYLQALRVNYAKNLLDMYGDKLKSGETARLCGFSDPLYFSRVFKNQTGMSPREYLRSRHG